MRELSIGQARRIALAAQGLDRPRPSGRIDRRHFRRVLRQLGLIQLDTVNVFARAHYMPFFLRLGAYSQAGLDEWLWHSGELFEYWGHAISVMPVDDFHLLRYRMQAPQPWQRIRRLMHERPGYVEQIRDEVLEHGPMTMAELEDGGQRLDGWYRSEARLALEHLFTTGQLAAVRKPDFTRVYGAPEAFLPPRALERRPASRSEAHRALLEKATRSLGIGNAAEIADYYRLPRREAQVVLDDLVEDRCLERVAIRGLNAPAYLHPEARRPRRIRARGLVNPFDSLIWHRGRIEALWGLHYRIEIYVPAAERQYGYYVLPFLMGEDFAARVDLKAARQARQLLVRAAWLEPERDAREVAGALAEELRLAADWMGLDEIVVEPRGDLSTALRREIRSARRSP